MQKHIKLTKVASIVVLLALVVMMSASCSTSNQYGCPNKLESGVVMP